MPFHSTSTKYRRYGQFGPYGPAAEFATGSGERLAARKRETAQTKASTRRYPGMLPQDMKAMAGGMFGSSQSAECMDSLGGIRHGAGFDQFEDGGWEELIATIPHPFSRSQFQTPSTLASFRSQDFGRQRQSFWPGGDMREGGIRGQSMRRPAKGAALWEELYAWRQPVDDHLGAHSGLGAGPLPRSFDKYQRGSFGTPRSELFGNDLYHGFGVERGNFRPNRRLADESDCGCCFDAHGAQPHSSSGDPRNSFERSRPEDL